MGMGDLYVDRHEAASSRPRETKCRPSGTSPEETFTHTQNCEHRSSSDQREGLKKNITYYANISIHSCYSLVRARLE